MYEFNIINMRSSLWTMKTVFRSLILLVILVISSCNYSQSQLNDLVKGIDSIKISRYSADDTSTFYVADKEGLTIFKNIINGALDSTSTDKQVGLIEYFSKGRPILEAKLFADGIVYKFGEKEYKERLTYQAGMYLDQISNSFLTGYNIDPLSFINTVILDKKNELIVTASGTFPDNWIKDTDVDSLIKLVKSKEKCPCLVSPLSSFLPFDSVSQVGGYAILMVKAYKEGKNFGFGLYICPKENDKEADSLIRWYSQKKGNNDF